MDTYRTPFFNPYHNPKRWILRTITDEESRIQRDKVSCLKLLQQGVVQQGTDSVFAFSKSAAPTPDSVPLALQTRTHRVSTNQSCDTLLAQMVRTMSLVT